MSLELPDKNVNPYQIEVNYLLPPDISQVKCLAFVSNAEDFQIIISDRHEKIINDRNLDRIKYRGGWIYSADNRITFTSAYLGSVEDQNKEMIRQAIKNALKINLIEK